MTLQHAFRRLLFAFGVALGAMIVWPAATSAADGRDFCWKDSYGRGVGTIPNGCAANQDRIGLLCYDKCGPGMQRFGFDCHSVCPAGMADQGLFCRRTEYGRGGGYPWKFGDALNDSGMTPGASAITGAATARRTA